jgi:hypothetical protein
MENLGDEWLVIYLTLLFGRNRICQTRYAHHMAEILVSFPAANSSEFVARLDWRASPAHPKGSSTGVLRQWRPFHLSGGHIAFSSCPLSEKRTYTVTPPTVCIFVSAES